MHPENLKVIFWTMRDRGHAVGDHLPVSTPRRRHCSIWQPQGTTCKPGSRQLVTVLNAAEICIRNMLSLLDITHRMAR